MKMKKLTTVLISFMLCGCFFSTPNSKFYLLEKSAFDHAFEERINVAVQDITLPDYLQKPQIVLQKQGDTELKVSEFNRWASDLENMIQTAMIENLQAAFPNGTIKPLLYGGNEKYIVKVEIEKLSGYLREDAYLTGVWQILTPGGKVIKTSDFKLKTPAGKTYASYAKAQSKLISELCQDIASNLKK